MKIHPAVSYFPFSGAGFQPVNPPRIIGVAGLNEGVRDGIGCGPTAWTVSFSLGFLQAFKNLFDYFGVQELSGMKRDYDPSPMLQANSMAPLSP
jgi:hypothetical protein